MRCEYWPIPGLYLVLEAAVLFCSKMQDDDAHEVDSMVVNCNWIRVGKEGRGVDLAIVAVIAFVLVHVLLFIVYKVVITVQRFCAKSTKTLEPTSSAVATAPDI